MQSNLIVIGNGFDLESGLESSYSHFFNKRVSEELRECFSEIFQIFIDNKDESYYTIYFSGRNTPVSIAFPLKGLFSEKQIALIQNADLTVWDFIFLLMGMTPSANWHNVEDNIRCFLANEVDINKDYERIGLIDSLDGVGESSIMRLCCILAYDFFSEDRYKKSKDIYDFLFKELRLFEMKFVDYLNEEFALKKNVYDLKYPVLIQTILNPSYEDSPISNYSILSFNYTRHQNMRGKISNIHGTLQDKNIIFGIDQKDVGSFTPEYRFTKTFRKLTQVKKSNDSVVISGKNKLKQIFFYGHSLSELDYSYFQSIFDYYDIYNSEVKLIFCCTHFDKNKTEEEILQIQTLAASKMIELYGSSMGKEREQHGKNLLHKLMLEDRVDVRIIKPNY